MTLSNVINVYSFYSFKHDDLKLWLPIFLMSHTIDKIYPKKFFKSTIRKSDVPCFPGCHKKKSLL